MNKRGQVYVLAAIILSIIIYGMVSVTNKAVQESVASDFERISQNYALESAKLVNSFEPGADILEAFQAFTVQFASYAKAQSPRFELISVLDYENKLYIGNFLKNHIIVRCEPASLCEDYPPIEGCYKRIKADIGFEGFIMQPEVNMQDVTTCGQVIDYGTNPISKLNITIENIAYQFELRRGQPEIVVVGWESSSKQRKVFTKGNFITATGSKTSLSDYCTSRTEAECNGVEAGRYCHCPEGGCTPCLPNCPYISTEEECGINSAQCYWDSVGKECLNVGGAA